LSRERTNIRTVTLGDLGGRRFDVVVADLSFISLRTVAVPLVSWTRPDGDLVVLVKPQFEVGRRQVSRGRGVIRDPDLWRRALDDVIAALEAAGATMMGVMVSPLRGADGNVEFLAHGRPSQPAGGTTDVAAAIAAAVREASAGRTGVPEHEG
jgi:23S rRNA (cytidine1920-2'-O)/16S rRNA (cytidine1409-2'-O)-methyltransferase